MKRSLLILLAVLTACSPPKPSATFPMGQWGLLSAGQVVAVFTFNADHTLADPNNNRGIWSIDGDHLKVDVTVTTKQPVFQPDTSMTFNPLPLGNAHTPTPTPSPVPTPAFKMVTNTTHDDFTIISKTDDTVTLTEKEPTGFGQTRTLTVKYLPPIK